MDKYSLRQYFGWLWYMGKEPMRKIGWAYVQSV